MEVPLAYLPAVLWLSLGALVALSLLMARDGRTMSRNGAGIVAFELAGERTRAQEILAGWGEQGRAAAARQSALDYLLAIAYVGFLGGWALWVAQEAADHGWFDLDLVLVGRIAAGAVALAGVLDWVENTAMLQQLGRTGPTDANVAVAYQSARLKFALLLFVAVAAGLGTAFVWLLGGTAG